MTVVLSRYRCRECQSTTYQFANPAVEQHWFDCLDCGQETIHTK